MHSLIDGPDYQKYNDKLAVIGVLFRVEAESHPIFDQMQLEERGTIENFDLSVLFESGDDPKSQAPFIHYKGSLTTPPCSGIVNWLMYRDVLPVSEEHALILQRMWYRSIGCFNFRECCPLYGRRIVKNFE